MSKLSILKFIKEVSEPFLNNTNQKYISWGIDNMFPMEVLNLYDSVPEHSSAVDFIENLITAQGVNIEDLDYWIVKKIVSDYILFGGYAVQIIMNRDKQNRYEYVDISKCRYSSDCEQIGVSNNWGNYRTDVKWYPVVTDKQKQGIFLFKNNKSRYTYPKPYYLSGFKSLDTLTKIIDYHNNNASNGFSPNVLINVHGVPEPEVQEQYERSIKEKFTGDGQKFLLSFSDSEETKTSVEKLQDDNLDAKFKDLQVFLRDEIIIAHKLTSGSLIGINQSTGFNKIEYDESLNVFKENVILGFRNELTYSLTKLTGIDDIKFLDIEEKKDITVDQTTVDVEGGQAL